MVRAGYLGRDLLARGFSFVYYLCYLNLIPPRCRRPVGPSLDIHLVERSRRYRYRPFTANRE